MKREEYNDIIAELNGKHNKLIAQNTAYYKGEIDKVINKQKNTIEGLKNRVAKRDEQRNEDLKELEILRGCTNHDECKKSIKNLDDIIITKNAMIKDLDEGATYWEKEHDKMYNNACELEGIQRKYDKLHDSYVLVTTKLAKHIK